ncbi:MAG: NRDE family protein [Weeksellaceae bacterium]|nr:NRDE family protein [Weeksellaceae bacterium]
MCIVSLYTDYSSCFLLTHNRDEDYQRPSSNFTHHKLINNHQAEFPLDLLANGTWILTSDQFTTCMLNGAREVHVYQPPYTKSRGTLPMELLKHSSVDEYFSKLEAIGMQPFTQLIVSHNPLKVHILRWDGEQKDLETVEDSRLVLSSSTLYSTKEKEMHKSVLQQNLSKPITADKMAEKHRELLWKFDPMHPLVKTTSITQVTYKSGKAEMSYQPIQYNL